MWCNYIRKWLQLSSMLHVYFSRYSWLFMVRGFFVSCVWNACCSSTYHDRRKSLHRKSHWPTQCGEDTDIEIFFNCVWSDWIYWDICHFADNILKWISFNEKVSILIQISSRFVPMAQLGISNNWFRWFGAARIQTFRCHLTVSPSPPEIQHWTATFKLTIWKCPREIEIECGFTFWIFIYFSVLLMSGYILKNTT